MMESPVSSPWSDESSDQLLSVILEVSRVFNKNVELSIGKEVKEDGSLASSSLIGRTSRIESPVILGRE